MKDWQSLQSLIGMYSLKNVVSLRQPIASICFPDVSVLGETFFQYDGVRLAKQLFVTPTDTDCS